MTTVTVNGTTYNKEVVKNLIKTDNRWTLRTLIILYNRQTTDEQQNQQTTHCNSRGFNGTDSVILSSFSVQVNRGRTLSEKQMNVCRKLLPKYWKQVIDEINIKNNSK